MDVKSDAPRAGKAATSRSEVRAIALFIPLLFLLSLSLTGASAAPRLAGDSELATAGYYRLSWQDGAPGAEYELQESSGAGFAYPRLIYRGPDLATVISGQDDGDYYYRIRALEAGRPGDWSETVKIRVEHHPLSRALAFFAAGAVVFIAILLLVVRGARN